ncbi:uncharacterized protein LOC117502948 isoform X3 [Thalassophryne amazonica]|uniref:uncharacterized protein LOC117502948 isoform X3 n=1 Tax=Thalassophryne amazonica TaxID=390379 RepID=UPI0014723B5B|nr:uncharacterized protein LOC117502948 isoform X3 [Thalassophryne amazonica]
MSVLLKEIEKFDRSAPSVFQEVGLQMDDEIQTLTRDDLQDLFPGRKNFKLRKNIFDIIYKQRSDDVLLREPKDCLSWESFQATLRANSVLTEYLNTLKELKTQVNNVQMVIERHVDQLEELNKNQHQKAKRGQWFPKIFSSFGSKTPQTDHHKPAAVMVATVTYGAVISGVTFGSHQQLMDSVIHLEAGERTKLVLKESKSPEDVQILIVFCPVSSRLDSDVEAAMNDVTGDKPVILVLMHHTWDSTYTSYQRPQLQRANVVMVVNVLFHDTKGLLRCQQNEDAALEIRQELLKHSRQTNILPRC